MWLLSIENCHWTVPFMSRQWHVLNDACWRHLVQMCGVSEGLDVWSVWWQTMHERLNLKSAGNLRRNKAQAKSSSGGGHLSVFPLRLVYLRSFAFNLTICTGSSSLAHIICGVLQGSILGPFFFKNDLFICFRIWLEEMRLFFPSLCWWHTDIPRPSQWLRQSIPLHLFFEPTFIHLNLSFCLPRPFAGPVLCIC